MAADFTTAAGLLAGWRDDLTAGTPRPRFPVGAGGFAHVRIGPGLLTLVGGAPGVGKTALTMQWAVDALRASTDLNALVCNVEMTPAALLDRQLARLAGIDATVIRDRRLTDVPADRLAAGFTSVAAVADRLAFLDPPYTLRHVASAATAFDARLIVVDYMQRVPLDTDAPLDRAGVAAAMQMLRRFADAGRAVVAVAAVGRGVDARGQSSYGRPTLASFRESSELEYGADDAYVLDNAGEALTLHHLKARHGEPVSLALRFDGRHQHFTVTDPGDLDGFFADGGVA